MMSNRLTSIFFLLLHSCLLAQWSVPDKILFDSPNSEDRVIEGLAHPIQLDAGINAGVVRNNATRIAQAFGITDLIAEINPPPNEYTTGMQVVIFVNEIVDSNATLNLNNLGPVILTGSDSTPLDAGLLHPGIPYVFTYNGTSFELMNSAYFQCPSGYITTSPRTCIESSSRDSLTFFQASLVCQSQGARLCGFSEWIHACNSTPSFINSVFGGEWVDSAANELSAAKYMGTGNPNDTTPAGGNGGQSIGCQWGFFVTPTSPRRFRCCISK